MEGERKEKLKIDVSKCEKEANLIEMMISEFGFPNIYGKNWESIRKHFFYDPEMKVPEFLTIKGVKTLKLKSPKLHDQLMKFLNEHSLDNQSFKFEIEK